MWGSESGLEVGRCRVRESCDCLAASGGRGGAARAWSPRRYSRHQPGPGFPHQQQAVRSLIVGAAAWQLVSKKLRAERLPSGSVEQNEAAYSYGLYSSGLYSYGLYSYGHRSCSGRSATRTTTRTLSATAHDSSPTSMPLHFFYIISEHADGKRRGVVSTCRCLKTYLTEDLSDAALRFDPAFGVRRRHSPKSR